MTEQERQRRIASLALVDKVRLAAESQCESSAAWALVLVQLESLVLLRAINAKLEGIYSQMP